MNIYLGLGTNLGNKEQHLRDAVQQIEKRVGEVTSLSAFYETAPWGFSSENSFLNAAVCVETSLPALCVLHETQAIERELGRSAKSVNRAYADRVIDIDLLCYGEQILTLKDLTLPHPLMTERRFVMEPLAGIAPTVIHPVLGQTMQELLEALP